MRSTDGISVAGHSVAAHVVTVVISHLGQFAFFAAEPGQVESIYLPAISH